MVVLRNDWECVGSAVRENHREAEVLSSGRSPGAAAGLVALSVVTDEGGRVMGAREQLRVIGQSGRGAVGVVIREVTAGADLQADAETSATIRASGRARKATPSWLTPFWNRGPSTSTSERFIGPQAEPNRAQT